MKPDVLHDRITSTAPGGREIRPRLYSAAQVRDLDRRAIQEIGIPGYTLMQRAAGATFSFLLRRWSNARRIVVLCGPGNNGGDGFEVACLAHAAGIQVDLAQVGEPAQTGDAVKARAAWERRGVRFRRFDPAFADDEMTKADVIVDAIFGIGITRVVEGEPRVAIEAINRRRPSQGVLAVDIPSGLDADTGAIHGVAVSADATMSFIGRKCGLYVGHGPDLAGLREFSALELPVALISSPDAQMDLLSTADLQRALPRRPRSSHKGRHGHVMLIGGEHGMAGAILLATRGALRGGAGLVSVATRNSHAGALVTAQPEAMFHGCDKIIDAESLFERADVIAIGPGLGQNSWARRFLERVLISGKPMVLDADALNIVSERADLKLPANAVITPHPGEAARLIGSSRVDVQQDRVAAVRALREKRGAVAVLKGAGSLVCGRDLALCEAGNPGMGAGGMGDVLTGLIAALLGQGLDAETAARCGVLAHAMAGDLAAKRGERGLLPSDLIDSLRDVLNP